jgi:phage terminase small subunit
MGRRKDEGPLEEAPEHPRPKPPEGISAEALEWWDGVLAEAKGSISPHQAVILKIGCRWITLFSTWEQRLRTERAMNALKPVDRHALVENLTLATKNVLLIAGEMGLTPKSKRYIGKSRRVDKKKAGPRTKLEDLKPSQFKPFGAVNGVNGDQHR